MPTIRCGISTRFRCSADAGGRESVMREKGDMVMDRMILALMAILIVPAVARGQEPAVPAPSRRRPRPQRRRRRRQSTGTGRDASREGYAGPRRRRRIAGTHQDDGRPCSPRAVLGGAEQAGRAAGQRDRTCRSSPAGARTRLRARGLRRVLPRRGPEMQPSLVWSMRRCAAGRAVSQLANYVASLPPRGRVTARCASCRRRPEQALRAAADRAAPGPPTPVASPRRTSTARPTRSTAGAGRRRRAPILRDPSDVYTEAIKPALIDAMLEHSRGMNIAPTSG